VRRAGWWSAPWELWGGMGRYGEIWGRTAPRRRLPLSSCCAQPCSAMRRATACRGARGWREGRGARGEGLG
jgi:hypothetical protein